MYKIAFISLLFLLPMVALGQSADTIKYGTLKLTSSDKFDKRPEPSFDLIKFIGKKIRYPDEAREEGIQGKVYIQFTIDETGKVAKPTIVSSPHKSLSDETIRLIGLMPGWSPADLNGKPIPISLTMPLNFQLQ
jgi:TonB family protein